MQHQNFVQDLHLQTVIAPTIPKGFSLENQLLNLQPKLTLTLATLTDFVNSDAGHDDCSISEKRPDHLNIDADMLRMEKISEILATLKFADSRNPSPTHSEYNSEIDDHRETSISQNKLKRSHSSNTINDEESMSDLGDLPCSSQSSDSEIRTSVIEDDEWLDSGKNELLSPDNSGRRKAPSGTACERHKRWKKRCPDDCPFRSQKQKKIFATQQKPSDSNEELGVDPAEQLVNLTEQLISKLQGEEWEKTSLKLCSLIRKLKETQVIGSLDLIDICKEPSTKSECLELVAMVMRQIQENIEVPSTPRKRLTTSSSYEDLSGSDYIYYDEDLDEFSSKKGKRRSTDISDELFELRNKRGGYTIACEYHTSLHARCPHNCPDRRLSKVRVEKPETQPKRYKKSSDESSSESDSDRSDSKPRDSIKKKKTSKKGLNSRVGRKYLPQACERHKLLHARCPANCPDRIARDAMKTQIVN